MCENHQNFKMDTHKKIGDIKSQEAKMQHCHTKFLYLPLLAYNCFIFNFNFPQSVHEMHLSTTPHGSSTFSDYFSDLDFHSTCKLEFWIIVHKLPQVNLPPTHFAPSRWCLHHICSILNLFVMYCPFHHLKVCNRYLSSNRFLVVDLLYFVSSPTFT